MLYERKTDRVHFLLAGALDVNTTHGTGCVFSSVLAARLALGDSLLAAATAAKDFTNGGDPLRSQARRRRRPGEPDVEDGNY